MFQILELIFFGMVCLLMFGAVSLGLYMVFYQIFWLQIVKKNPSALEIWLSKK